MENNFEERCLACGIMYPARRLMFVDTIGYLCIRCSGKIWQVFDALINVLTLKNIVEKEEDGETD